MGRSEIVRGLGSTLCAAIIAAAALTPSSALADGGSRRGWVRTHFPGEETHPVPAAAGGALTYHGGPVISSAQVVAVMWGATTASQLAFAKAWFPAVMSSTYIDALAEFSTAGQTGANTNQKVVRGGFVGAYPITPAGGGGTVDDTAIGPELVAQIGSGKLPKPTLDAQGYTNTLYVIFFAPGITVTQGGGSSCVSGGFCGYHGSVAVNGKSTPYAVIPDMGSGSQCATGCGPQSPGTEQSSLGATVSHEVAEAITDEGVGENSIAWYDDTDNGEIGDICDTGGSNLTGVGGTGQINGQYVQYEYSNLNNKCELDNPSVPPQGGCTKNSDCAAPTPVCLTAKSTCVQCAANSDCSGSTPVCDTTANTCRACKADSDCSGSTPVCALGGGGGGDAGTVVPEGGTSSDPNAGKCVQCTKNAQCTTTAPVCKSSDTCGGCTSNTDCTDPSNPTCNTGSGQCGPAPASSSSGGGSGGGSGSGSGGSGSGSGSGGTTDDGGTGGSGSSSGSNSAFPGGGSSSSNGCGCMTAGAPASSGIGFAGLLLGLAAFVGRKRSSKR